jgi:tyrosinase
MPRNLAAQAAVDEILSGSSRPARQEAVVAFKAAMPAQPRRRMFVPFDNDDLSQAMALMNELIAVAERDGIAAAVAEVRRLLPEEELRGLTQYALKLFMTHYPPAREQLRFRPLEQRQPNLVFGAARGPQAVAALAAAAPYPSNATPPEDQVSFWREDPLINEHHEHWHLVYPTSAPLGNRHGELFA